MISSSFCSHYNQACFTLFTGSRRTGIPRATSRTAAYADIKPRTDTGLRPIKGGHFNRGQSRRNLQIKDVFQFAAESKLHRSSSAIDIRPRRTRYPLSSPSFPLRRSKSLGDFFAQYTKNRSSKVSVDYEYFEDVIRSRLKIGKGGMKRPRTSLGFPRLSIDVTRGGGKGFNQSPINRPEKKEVVDKKDSVERENNLKALRPILRRSKLFNEGDKPQDGEEASKSDGELKPPEVEQKRIPKWETPKSPSRETTINGIPLSKLSKPGIKAPSKTSTKSSSKVEETEKKSIEEDEKEGARNFARCLLGILPSVLTLTEPQAVDEALQQFASDVCEAVCCMALKRKNVPNFGTLMRHFEQEDEVESGDPLLNADGVYLTVLETLTLNYKLSKVGYYKKKGANPVTTQVSVYFPRMRINHVPS